MKKIKMLAFDVDGTFVNTQKQIPNENIELLKFLKEKNVHTVVSTGRMPQSAIELAEGFHMGVHFTACNGSTVYVNDGNEHFELLNEIYYEYDVLKELLEYLDGFGLYYHFYEKEKVYTNRPAEIVRKFYKLFINDLDKYVKICDDLSSSIYPEIKVAKVGLYGDGSFDFQKMKSNLEKNPKLSVMLSHDSYIDINPAGVDKWWGLKKMIEHFGISEDEIMYFGDQENDLKCIKNAGMGIAMLNGTQIIKSNADYVTEFDNDHAGVAKCVYKLLEEGKISF